MLQAKFLIAFRELANISRAAKAAGVGRATVYKWLAGDPVYAAAFEEAKEEALDLLEFEARRRAVDGVEKPIFQSGRQVTTVREYSDNLLIFLLKAARPEKYGHRYVPAPAAPLEAIVAGVAEGGR